MNIIENIYVTEGVTLITINNSPSDIRFISEVFELISAQNIDVDMISGSPQTGALSSLSFTISDESFGALLPLTTKFRDTWPSITINVSGGNSKISISGKEMRGLPGVASKVFKAASEVNSDIRLITTSEIDISILVTQADLERTVDKITEAFD